MRTPINDGLLQSDLDCAGFDLLNFAGGGGGTGHGIPAGGTTGQSLTKIDATDYNAHWATITGGGGGSLPEGWVSVMDYGAARDGVTDDTAAAQAAISAATVAVYFPPGNYKFTGSIGAVPANISLVGSFLGPTGAVMDTSTTYDQSHQRDPTSGGTCFLLTANAGNGSATPFISITDNCAVIGITFYWPNQSRVAATPTAYPWAIKFAGGTAGSVKYCNFVNGYQCIWIENTLFSLVEEVRGQALYRGIKCEGNYDVTRLRGVHFNASWTTTGPGAWQLFNSIAFQLGRNDLLIMEDCFAFWYATWVYFVSDYAHNFHGPNACWAEIRGGGGDYCTKPLWINDSQGQGIDIDGVHLSTTISGGNVAVVFDSSNSGTVRIHNSMMLSWEGLFGTVAGTGDVTVDNCHFLGNGAGGTSPATFAVTGWTVASSGNFAMRDCHFNTIQTHLSLGSSLNRAVVTSNIAGGTFTLSNSMVAGRFVINDNTGGDTVYIGTDARLVSISGGVKLEVRNATTGAWVEGTRYTNP